MRMPIMLAIGLGVAGCRGDATKPAPSEARSEPTDAGDTKAAANAETDAPKDKPTLADARAGFSTKIVTDGEQAGPPDVPPPDGPFELVRYDAPVGKLAAYVTKDPGDGERHPAIVWLTGGDTNSIGDVWTPAVPEDDQTAAAFRKAGVVMMFPSQRGGNDNPGRREGFLGEVDDVLAATDYLVARDYVDPDRVFLGGHSTGGTLALLVAATTDRYRATFAFGPVHDPRAYGGAFVYHDVADAKENELRAPILWLDSIRTPTFVIEGIDGNSDAVRILDSVTSNPNVHFLVLEGVDHFGTLAPVNDVLAKRVLADDGPRSNLALDHAELQQLFR